MKSLFLQTAFWVCLSSLLLLHTSCSDDDILQEPTTHSTTFRIYETNEDFPEINPTASRFVSEGAIVTIWKLNDHNGYDIVKQLRTGLDGVATYNHNEELLFYSVEKMAAHPDEYKNRLKKNLASLQLRDENGNVINTVQFQVEGVFTSQEDIDSHAKFNFGVSPEDYTPEVGALKFKDINQDGFIDIEDSISRAMIDVWHSNEEEVYLTTTK